MTWAWVWVWELPRGDATGDFGDDGGAPCAIRALVSPLLLPEDNALDGDNTDEMTT